MAQNPSFPWVPSQGPTAQEDRNEPPQRRRLRAVFSAFQESGAGSSLALDILLHELAEEALSVPGASGSAIALRGAGNYFVCRAVAGEPTPALGTRIEAQGGLSAECVRTGRLQFCQDTEADARVDAEMCRAWGVRSLAIIPLFLQQKLTGILEVFSPAPNAFDRASIERLTTLGRYVVETVAFAERPVPSQQVIPAKPSSPFKPRIETWTETPMPEPTVPNPVGGPIAIPEPEKEAFSSDASSTIPTSPDVPTLGIPAPFELVAPSRRRNLGLALGALVAGLVAVAGLWWLPSENTRPTSQFVIAKQVPLAPDPATGMTASNTAARLPSSRTAKPSPSSKIQPASDAKGTDDPSSRSGGLVVYEKGKVVYRALPGNGSMIGPGVIGTVTTGPVTSAAETEKLGDTADAATITGGKLIYQVDPVMPADVTGLHLPEEVLLEGVVDRDGTVRDIRFLRGDARLAAAAIDAARQWRYEPFRANGERVDMLSTLSVRFR